MQLDEILEQLKQERDRINVAINALSSGSTETQATQGKRRGRPPGSTSQQITGGVEGGGRTRKKRVLSAEARTRMAEAAKRRWANARKGK
jgi:hypothetical protein